MRASERNILTAVAGLVLLAAFWFMILSPKRAKVTELSDNVTKVQAAVDAENQRADFGEAAKAQFASNYRKVVLLGKAAPEGGDSASFLVQLNQLAEHSKINFRGLTLQAGDAPVAAPPAQPGVESAPPASSQPSTTAPAAGQGETAASTGDTQPAPPAAATEATASTLPIGAGVGPASLNTLKYTLVFRGNYFDVATFMADVDSLVDSSNNKVVVDGRLSTVDGFALEADQQEGFPVLSAELSVTTYTTPPGQGTTAGATPGGPAPSIAGQDPQLASSQGAAP